MTILVTGAAGLLGRALISTLLNENFSEIKALDLFPEGSFELEQLGVECFKGDITRPKTIKKAFQDVETVFHTAALVREIYPTSYYYPVNYTGTLNVLDAFIENNCKKMIYTSTYGVYGFNQGSSPIPESADVDPMPGYRESKLMGESAVLRTSKEKSFFATVIRPSFIFGPNDKQFAPKVFNMVINNKRVYIIGKNPPISSFCYVDDMARAHLECSITPKANREIFNCASFAASSRDLFEAIAREANVSPKFVHLNYKTAFLLGLFSEIMSKLKKEKPLLTRTRVKQFGKPRLLDTSKISNIVGFHPQYNLEKAVKHTYSWLKATGTKSEI